MFEALGLFFVVYILFVYIVEPILTVTCWVLFDSWDGESKQADLDASKQDQ